MILFAHSMIADLVMLGLLQADGEVIPITHLWLNLYDNECGWDW
jgi:hypothetical protein